MYAGRAHMHGVREFPRGAPEMRPVQASVVLRQRVPEEPLETPQSSVWAELIMMAKAVGCFYDIIRVGMMMTMQGELFMYASACAHASVWLGSGG